MKRVVEILAPGGSVESIKAAVAAGADAIYTGGTMFGARAYANNLTEEQLLEMIDYVHLHGKKLYLTVNTLLKEHELEKKLYSYLLPYYKQGLDAVIVQDVGVLRFIKKRFPDLPIHASTQMTLAGVEGAKLLEEMGVERIVTSRELSANEVKAISDAVNVEIESFVHGALCYCYSGQCLFSSFLGGRSGNRGQCAQPCRLLYKAAGENQSKYLLSLKDINTLDIIPDLIEAGIYSFKIEGRMKKPEYVAAVSYMYRKYADLYLDLCETTSNPKKQYKVDPKDKEMLLDLYNRGGSHTGYYGMRNGRDMVSLDRPNHAGVPAVKIERKQGRRAYGKALVDISPQDVIELPQRKGEEKPDTYTCKDGVRKGQEMQIPIFPNTPVQKGMIWMRTRNASLINWIDKEFLQRKIKEKIYGKLKLSVGNSATLEVVMGDVSVFVEGNTVQEAQNQPMDVDRIKKQMNKTGNTPFEFECIDVELEGRVFVPMQELNELRRNALELLEKQVVEKYRRVASDIKEEQEENQVCEWKGYTASATTKEQINVLVKSPLIRRIYVDCAALPKIWKNHSIEEMISNIHEHGKEAYLIMPYIFRKQTSKLYDNAYDSIFTESWDGVLIRNYESFQFLRNHQYSKPIMTDYNMYQFNKQAKRFWRELGVDQYTAPLEMTAQELSELDIALGELVIYGYIPMMVSAGCVKKTLGNCKSESGITTITDRYRKEFVVKNECDYCYNIIYNYVPLVLSDVMDEVRRLSPSRVRLMFTNESAAEVKKVLTLYEEEKSALDGEFTRGHWKRGIK